MRIWCSRVRIADALFWRGVCVADTGVRYRAEGAEGAAVRTQLASVCNGSVASLGVEEVPKLIRILLVFSNPSTQKLESASFSPRMFSETLLLSSFNFVPGTELAPWQVLTLDGAK